MLALCRVAAAQAGATAPAAPTMTLPPATLILEPAGGSVSRWDEFQRLVARSTDEVWQRQPWEDSAYWRIAVAPYTYHFRYNAEHRHAYAIALERQREDGWLAGISPFRNSFGQASLYAYLGRRFENLLDQPYLFAQVSGGILYGYRGAYKNKVPLNFHGFAPGALVSLGLRSGRTSVTVHMLGDAGLMLQLAYDLR